MKFEILQRLFVDANPGGSIDFMGNGKYRVKYSPTGKVYTYRSTSHYALAERFGLIPEPEAITERQQELGRKWCKWCKPWEMAQEYECRHNYLPRGQNNNGAVTFADRAGWHVATFRVVDERGGVSHISDGSDFEQLLELEDGAWPPLTSIT